MKFEGFKDPQVAEKYISDRITDPMVHLPGKKATGFNRLLSTITLQQADQLFAHKGQNLIKEKPADQ